MDSLKMFTKFPQKIPDPFNLLGDQPKLAFRSQPGGIAKLATTRNISEKDSYWDQYVTLFDSASDVFSLITHNDVRRALYDAPENVATLIRVISARLFNLVSDHTFPAPPSSLASTLIRTGTGGSGERNATKEVLNCVRVLQRVLPAVFELESEPSRFEQEVLWRRAEAPEAGGRGGGAGGRAVEEASAEPQFVIEDEDESEDEEGERATRSPRPQAQPQASEGRAAKPKETLPSVAERLFSCLIDLMFCCGFTLPTKIQVDHYKINYIIWEKGVGSTADPGPSQQYDGNKTEVLRLLLVLLSRQIYVPPSALFTSPSQYTLHFVRGLARRDVLTVLCSLMNTAMNAAHYPAVGGAANVANVMGSVAGRLPYNHLLLKGEDPRTSLVSMCFQVLCVLLDFQSGTARDEASGPTAKTNAFRYFIAKLHRPNDFAFILSGMVGIFEDQMASVNGLLPGAKKSVPYMVEAIIFLWKMVELNKKFRAYLLDSDKATDILAYLLCYSLEIKDKPEQHGMCRVLSYLIQSLSAERAFGLKLSSPIKAQIPQKYATMGTAGDFMVQSIYSMVATTSGSLNSLYPALIIALANSTPYFKNLSVTSSARLLQLFTAFSNPSFLLSDEGHPRLLFFMLEAFNGVVLHNLSENPNLVYGLIRAHKHFEDLGTFTLARGLREIRRIQQAKEERANGSVDKGKRRATDEEEGDPASEKARLLSREAADSLDLEAGLAGVTLGASTRSGADEEATAATRPLMSPTASGFGSPAGSNVEVSGNISEKARGKMRAAGRSLSGDMTGSLERLASAGVGRNGFVPTQDWVASWHQGLPLDTVMLVIAELLPKVQSLQASLSTTTANSAIIDMLRSANLDHVLPTATPLAPRPFMWSDASIVWLTSLIWGEIYVRGMTPLGIWNSTSVRLFYVKHAQAHQRQITETVTNVVGGLLGRTESTQSLSRRQ